MSSHASFIIDGGREKLDSEDRARALLPPHNAHYDAITLSNKSFSLNAAKVFAPFLAAQSALRNADLSDIIAGRSTEEAIAVLSELCPALSHSQLRSLDLSHNAIGARGVSTVAEMLRTQRQLQSVMFNNDGLQGQTVRVIVDALLHPFSVNVNNDTGAQSPVNHYDSTNIQHIEFSRNLLQDEGPRALVPLVQHSPKLRTIIIASSRVSSVGGLALCQALPSLSSLESLNLSDSSLGPEAGLILAKELLVPVKTQHLRSLNLGDIGINDSKDTRSSIRAIIQSLHSSKVAPHLEVLDLNSNEINASLVRLLSKGIKNKKKLKTLNLEGNEIHSQGANYLAQALTGSQSLEALNLTDNGIGARALQSLVKLLSSVKLRSLLLNGNKFDSGAMESLRDAVTQYSTELSTLSDNDEDDEDITDDDAADAEDAENEADDVIAETEEAENAGGDSEVQDAEVDRLADELKSTHV